MAYTTIDDPTAYFNTSLYAGTGAAHNIIGTGFQPDLVWIKERSSTSSHLLNDSSRGAGENMYPDTTAAEGTNTTLFTSFNSDGFTVGDTGQANDEGETYVAWQWKCNGGTTETAVDESGDNPANVRQTNATAGFSIITSTGRGGAGTIAHGLGAVPHWIISKGRSDSGAWAVYHQGNTAAPATDFLNLASDGATTDSNTYYNDTAPTSSVFTLGTTNDVNGDARTYVHYLWTEIQGYSKFGSYTGNGSTNGPFYYTGFKPAWLMIKNLASGESWEMWDNARDPDNVVTLRLKADTGGADASGTFMDFLSNGVKHRNYSGGHNNDGESYIYMAVAASPFVTSNGVPTNAR